ncbi:MAG: twin-arginine translocase TatA/TatE family subunit [Pseudomonadota bacterium]
MDASFPEFFLLLVIGLIVLGPERMAQVAKKIGHFVGYARRMSRNLQTQLEDELEMKQIRESLPTRVDLKKELGLDALEQDIEKLTEPDKPKPAAAITHDTAERPADEATPDAPAAEPAPADPQPAPQAAASSQNS